MPQFIVCIIAAIIHTTLGNFDSANSFTVGCFIIGYMLSEKKKKEERN